MKLWNLDKKEMELREKLYKKRSEWQNDRIICFTMDVDWASEYVIKESLQYFLDLQIPLTVFITHKSETLDKMAENDLIDLQLHPNFIQPSSQGNNQDDVIEYCMQLLPKAKMFRGHRWYASNDVYDKLFNQGIRYESNLCTMMDITSPFLHRSGMIGFPVFLEDGALLQYDYSLKFVDTKELYDCGGLKVIDIHPMHFMVNTPYFRYTRDIKDKMSRQEWNAIDKNTLEKLRYRGRGVSDYIKELIDYSKDSQKILSFRDLLVDFEPNRLESEKS